MRLPETSDGQKVEPDKKKWTLRRPYWPNLLSTRLRKRHKNESHACFSSSNMAKINISQVSLSLSLSLKYIFLKASFKRLSIACTCYSRWINTEFETFFVKGKKYRRRDKRLDEMKKGGEIRRRLLSMSSEAKKTLNMKCDKDKKGFVVLWWKSSIGVFKRSCLNVSPLFWLYQ